MNSQTGAKPKGGGGIARGVPPGPPPPPPGPPLAPGSGFVVSARIIDRSTSKPVSGVRYSVVDSTGATRAVGQTDWQGTVHHELPAGGKYEIRIT